MMSETSSSENPEFCCPSRRGSTTVCVAAETYGQEHGLSWQDKRGQDSIEPWVGWESP
jgi:hypothetical protein